MRVDSGKPAKPAAPAPASVPKAKAGPRTFQDGIHLIKEDVY